jgi:hypothetical protein
MADSNVAVRREYSITGKNLSAGLAFAFSQHFRAEHVYIIESNDVYNYLHFTIKMLGGIVKNGTSQLVAEMKRGNNLQSINTAIPVLQLMTVAESLLSHFIWTGMPYSFNHRLAYNNECLAINRAVQKQGRILFPDNKLSEDLKLIGFDPNQPENVQALKRLIGGNDHELFLLLTEILKRGIPDAVTISSIILREYARWLHEITGWEIPFLEEDQLNLLKSTDARWYVKDLIDCRMSGENPVKIVSDLFDPRRANMNAYKKLLWVKLAKIFRGVFPNIERTIIEHMKAAGYNVVHNFVMLECGGSTKYLHQLFKGERNFIRLWRPRAEAPPNQQQEQQQQQQNSAENDFTAKRSYRTADEDLLNMMSENEESPSKGKRQRKVQARWSDEEVELLVAYKEKHGDSHSNKQIANKICLEKAGEWDKDPQQTEEKLKNLTRRRAQK